METAVNVTPLHSWHQNQGAHMANFGDYEMPLWYSSVKDEHLSVLTRAGLFDTSHMAGITLIGPDAEALLQHCFTNDLAACIGPSRKPLSPGRCIYGAFLDERGHTIDDAIIFFLAVDTYFVVVNAGMGHAITAHLKQHKNGWDVTIQDMSDQLGKVDIQGPASATILSRILADPQAVFASMPYFSFKGHYDTSSPLADTVRLQDGTPLLLSRTGYTGEFGFEIFIAPEHLSSLWEQVLAAGQEEGITPCGLAARDSLRAGASLALSHQDIGDWPFLNHPWPFALPYTDKQQGFSKDFIGRSALEALTAPSFTQIFVGKDLRKISAGEGSLVIDSHGETIGTVLTCATDMGIGLQDGTIFSVASPDKPEGFKAKGLCCGFIRVSRKLALGEQVSLADSRRKIIVTIVDNVRPHRTARKALADMLR